MVNKKALQNLRSNTGIDALIRQMMATSAKIGAIQGNLAELKQRVANRERTVEEIESSFLKEAAENGKNEAARKALFMELTRNSISWQKAYQEVVDTRHHRDMVQAELNGLTARFSAQRHAADLIAAALNACSE